jgi:hypothetical protein
VLLYSFAEVDKIPALAAREAMPKLFLGVDAERGRVITAMNGAASAQVPPRVPKLGVLSGVGFYRYSCL